MNRPAALLVVLACACDRKASSQEHASPPVALPAHEADASTQTTSAPAEPARLRDDPCGAEPKSGKSIGHTSVVLKLELANGKKIAWKPNAKKVRGRYKGEIAAFRLAKALGVDDNVLPVCARAFDVDAITAVLPPNGDAAKLLASDGIVEDGKLYGAAISWFDGLSFWPLEKEPLRSESRAWLTVGKEVPAAKVDLARQTSSLIAFDFLTANWDRYSGENVGIDRSGSLVLYIDNDAAFMDGPPKAALAKNELDVKATDRFSRSFVARLRQLNDEELARVFGEESPGRPLLSPTVFAAVSKRAKDLVAVVDGKIKEHGESETLYFR